MDHEEMRTHQLDKWRHAAQRKRTNGNADANKTDSEKALPEMLADV